MAATYEKCCDEYEMERIGLEFISQFLGSTFQILDFEPKILSLASHILDLKYHIGFRVSYMSFWDLCHRFWA